MVANMVKKIKKEAKKVVLKNATGDYIAPVIDPLDALPAQDDKVGKFLKTDGEQASWEDIPPATMLNIKSDLMKANGKKVQFTCSEEAPVTVKFVDGTEQELTSIGDLDVSGFDVNTYPIGCNKTGVSSVSAIRGGLTVSTTGVASNFSSSNHVISNQFNPESNTWEMQFKITTGEEVSSIQQFLGGNISNNSGVEGGISVNSKFIYWLGTDTSGYSIAGGIEGTYTVLPNTTYWVKISFDGTAYKLDYSLDGITFVNDITTSSTSVVLADWKFIGVDGYSKTEAWLGTIDLSETYFKVGDTITWNGANILNESYPYLGLITLDSDKAIKNITNNYQTESINPLQEVTVHTKESYAKVTEDLPTNLDLIPFTFVDIDYSSYVTVSANTSYTLTKDVIVNTSSISTFTITKDGATYTVYGTWLPVRAGTTFKSSIAGKYYSFEGY